MLLLGASPFGGGWQTVTDVVRLVVIGLGIVVAVFAAQNFVNPYKREFLPPTKPGTLALVLFAVSATFTEIGRLGHDMGYWRLPVNLAGLLAATWTIRMFYKVPSASTPGRNMPSAHAEEQEARIAQLERELDDASGQRGQGQDNG